MERFIRMSMRLLNKTLISLSLSSFLTNGKKNLECLILHLDQPREDQSVISAKTVNAVNVFMIAMALVAKYIQESTNSNALRVVY